LSSDIHQRLQQFIQQENDLLIQIALLENNRRELSSEMGAQVVGELGGVLVNGLFGTGRSLGKKIGKNMVKQSRNNQIKNREENINYQHNNIVSNIKNYLSNISLKKINISDNNSYILLGKIEQAQNYVKIKTKI
jgi:hypothetical protein